MIPPNLKAHWGRLVDVLSDLTGYAAVRVPLQKASRPGEVTLDLTGYRQIDSYSCGAVASAMVVKFLRPSVSFEQTHGAVDPCQEIGASTVRVTRALRSLGIGVKRRTKLTFGDICTALGAGNPVLVCVTTSDPFTRHWVVIYGYGRRPKLLFVAGQGLHFIARQRVKWSTFGQQWASPGEGLVCWKANPRKTVRPSRPAKKK